MDLKQWHTCAHARKTVGLPELIHIHTEPKVRGKSTPPISIHYSAYLKSFFVLRPHVRELWRWLRKEPCFVVRLSLLKSWLVVGRVGSLCENWQGRGEESNQRPSSRRQARTISPKKHTRIVHFAETGRSGRGIEPTTFVRSQDEPSVPEWCKGWIQA